MGRYAEVLRLIGDAIDEVNRTREGDRALPTGVGTVLLGPSGVLDSLTFVVLAVAIEEQFERAFDRPLSVIDLVMARPIEDITVGTLAEHIAARVDNGDHR